MIKFHNLSDLKQRKVLLTSFWRLRVQDGGVSREPAGGGEWELGAPLPALGVAGPPWLLKAELWSRPQSSHGKLPSVPVSRSLPSSKNCSHNGLRPPLMTSSWIDYNCKDPISNSGHIHRCQKGQDINLSFFFFGGGSTVQTITMANIYKPWLNTKEWNEPTEFSILGIWSQAAQEVLCERMSWIRTVTSQSHV